MNNIVCILLILLLLYIIYYTFNYDCTNGVIDGFRNDIKPNTCDKPCYGLIYNDKEHTPPYQYNICEFNQCSASNNYTSIEDFSCSNNPNDLLKLGDCCDTQKCEPPLCPDDFCNNNGSVSGGGYEACSCICDQGYSGARCEEKSKINSVSYCGGGNRAMFSYFAIYNTLNKNKNRKVNNDLFNNIDYISGNSGGAWFISHLAYAKPIKDPYGVKTDGIDIVIDYFEKDVYKQYFKNLWRLYDPRDPETIKYWSENNIPNLKENFDDTMYFIDKLSQDIFNLDVFTSKNDIIANYIMYFKNILVYKIQSGDIPYVIDILDLGSPLDLEQYLIDVMQKLFDNPSDPNYLQITNTLFKLVDFFKTVLVHEIKEHLQHLCVYMYGFLGISWHDVIEKFIFKDFDMEKLNMKDNLKSDFLSKNITFITGIHTNATINENITGQILHPEYYLDENKLNDEKLKYNVYPKLSQNVYEINNLHSVSKYYGDSIPIFLGNNITKIYPGENKYYKDRINDNDNVDTNKLREYSKNIDGFTVGGGGTYCKTCYEPTQFMSPLVCENNKTCVVRGGYKKEHIVVPTKPSWWPSFMDWVYPDSLQPTCLDDYCQTLPCICYNGTSEKNDSGEYICAGAYAQNCQKCNDNYKLVNVVVDNKIVSKRCVKIPEPSKNVNICNTKTDCENIKLSIIYKDNKDNISIAKNINNFEITNKIKLLDAMTSTSSAMSVSSNFIYNVFNNITNNYINNMHINALSYHITEKSSLDDIKSSKLMYNLLLNQNGLLDHISQQLINNISTTDIFQDIQLALFSKLGNTIKGSSLNSNLLEFNSLGIRDYINISKDTSLDDELKKKVEDDIPLITGDGGYIDNTGILANIKKFQDDDNERNCKLLSINSDSPKINYYKTYSNINNEFNISPNKYIDRVLTECSEKVYGTIHNFTELFGLHNWDHIDFNETKGNIIKRSKYISEYELIRRLNIGSNKYDITHNTSSMDNWDLNQFINDSVLKNIILFSKLITHKFQKSTMFPTGDKVYINKDVNNRELFRGTSIYTCNTQIFNSDDFYNGVIIDDTDPTGNKYINDINKIKIAYINSIKQYNSIQNFEEYYNKINSYEYNDMNRYFTLNKIDNIEYNYDNHIVSYYSNTTKKQTINSKWNYVINEYQSNDIEYRKLGFEYTYDMNYSRMIYFKNIKTVDNINFGIKDGTNVELYFLINYINLSLLGPTPEINKELLKTEFKSNTIMNLELFLYCKILDKLPDVILKKFGSVCDLLQYKNENVEEFLNYNLETVEKFIKDVIENKTETKLFNFDSIELKRDIELKRLDNLEKLIEDNYINILDNIH